MGARHVRRLPVLDKQGHLHGIVSMDDIVQTARRRGAPSAEAMIDALKRIGASRPVEIAVD
jgi:Mg/Co/Ni transporter MgtE